MSNINYNECGEAIYTDPSSHTKYKFDKTENKWILLNTEGQTQTSVNNVSSDTENCFENEFYFWSHSKQQWLLKSNHTWDDVKKCWIEKEDNSFQNYSVDEKGVRTYRDKDGSIFEWDEEKKAWFPKIDDDFLAYYQLNYGEYKPDTVNQPSSSKETPAASTTTTDQNVNDLNEQALEKSSNIDTKKRKKLPEPPKWFEVDEKSNTKVYVENLPLDITEEEFVEIMSKYGLILKDPSTHKYKVKLYRDAKGELKGDGLCTFIKVGKLKLNYLYTVFT